MCVHLFTLQHGDGAGRFAETHGVYSDEPTEIGEPVHHREADGTRIEALDIFVRKVGLEMLERVYAGPIVLEQVITYPHDRDRNHAVAPDIMVYQRKLSHVLGCAYTGLYQHAWQETNKVRNATNFAIVILLGAFGTVVGAQPVPQCPPREGVALQILGSGGPVADDSRASSGFVVWIDGQSRVLIDAGGGTFLRFGEAGADFAQLDFVGLSHFHTDHSADFPALLKSGYFSPRKRPLVVAGPGKGGPFPGLVAYLDSLLQAGSGAYGYLSGYLDGSGGLVRLDPVEVARESAAPIRVFGEDDGEVRIDALPVPHGIVPALGFRARARDVTIVFSSDQNGSDPAFVGFAQDATALVMHMPIPEGATGGALQLHAQPGLIGEIAAKASAEKLILSHFMARSLQDLDSNLDAVREVYGGEIIVGSDLACIILTD